MVNGDGQDQGFAAWLWEKCDDGSRKRWCRATAKHLRLFATSEELCVLKTVDLSQAVIQEVSICQNVFPQRHASIKGFTFRKEPSSSLDSPRGVTEVASRSSEDLFAASSGEQLTLAAASNDEHSFWMDFLTRHGTVAIPRDSNDVPIEQPSPPHEETSFLSNPQQDVLFGRVAASQYGSALTSDLQSVRRPAMPYATFWAGKATL